MMSNLILYTKRQTLVSCAAAFFALLFLPFSSAKANVASNDTVFMEWQGRDSLRLHFSLTAGETPLKSDYRMIAVPGIRSAADTLLLDTVEFAGRRNKKYNDRLAVLSRQARGAVYAPHDTLRVDTVIRAEPWMRDTVLRLCVSRVLDGCCEFETLEDECLAQTRYVRGDVPRVDVPVLPNNVAERLAKDDPLLEPVSDYRPFDPDMPLKDYPGVSYIRFAQDRWIIDDNFADNRKALNRLTGILERVEKDSASRIVKILIVGTASPDGPLSKNIRLAGQRAESLKKYIEDRFDTSGMEIELANAGEGWGNLIALLRNKATDDLPYRDEILRIIEETPHVDKREQLLRTFKGGRPFRHLLNLFDVQRTASAVRLYYEAQTDTVASIINDAMRLIQQGSYRMAVDMLEPLDDDRRYNALGTAYYMTGRKEEAKTCFEKAAALGDVEAKENLKHLTRSNKELLGE